MRSGPYPFACGDIEEEQEPPVVVVGGPMQDTQRVEKAADNGVEIGRLKRSVFVSFYITRKIARALPREKITSLHPSFY
jgi:hypothetical protein